jgi:hypothetical protein
MNIVPDPKDFYLIGHHHPLDGVANPNYKLLRFIHNQIFCEKKWALAFNGIGAAI